MRVKRIVFLLLALLGLVGAVLSLTMLISAVQFSEWGRVVLYSVTMAVCIEMAVVCFGKMKEPETAEDMEDGK